MYKGILRKNNEEGILLLITSIQPSQIVTKELFKKLHWLICVCVCELAMAGV